MKKGHLFTDGAARGNPGPAGTGVVLTDENGITVFEDGRFLGAMTNNQAEYVALVDGLKKALELDFSNLSIAMDSELIVKQIKGDYRVKNHGLKPYFKAAMDLLDKFDEFSIRHIPREENRTADRLANRAIDRVL